MAFFLKRTGSERKKAEEKQTPKNEPRLTKKPIFALPLKTQKKNFYAFIDASNLFWGGRESIGFGIDYRKLKQFLERKYNVSKIFWYAGLRIFDFEYSILDSKPIDLAKLSEYLKEKQKEASENEKELIERTLSKINFFQRLEEFGYNMKIKPAKVYYDEDDEKQERPILKANCDVDMTFDIMRYMEQYSGVVAMTGDGDFAPVLQYLKTHSREVIILSRWDRTAKDIKTIAGNNFQDFSRLKYVIKLKR